MNGRFYEQERLSDTSMLNQYMMSLQKNVELETLKNKSETELRQKTDELQAVRQSTAKMLRRSRRAKESAVKKLADEVVAGFD